MIVDSKSRCILVLLAFLIIAGGFCRSEAQEISLKIEGSIVMYETPGFLSNTNGAISTYVVRISRVLSGKEQSQYILLLSTHQFVKDQFNAKTTQEFSLIRSSGWDDKIRNTNDFNEKTAKRKRVPFFKLSKGVRLKDLPVDETLPAYVFLGNDYPNEWWKREIR